MDKAALFLDTRGTFCPVPLLRTRDRLRALPGGAILTVLADDPAAALDLRAFCRSHGHAVLDCTSESGGVIRLTLRKGAA